MQVLVLLVSFSMEVLHLMSFLMVSHIYESFDIIYFISLDNSQNYKDLDIIFKLNSPDHGLYGPGSVQPNSIHPAQMRDGSVTCQSIRLDAHNRKKTNLNKKRKVIDECDNQRWTIIRVRTIIRFNSENFWIPGTIIFLAAFSHFRSFFDVVTEVLV